MHQSRALRKAEQTNKQAYGDKDRGGRSKESDGQRQRERLTHIQKGETERVT